MGVWRSWMRRSRRWRARRLQKGEMVEMEADTANWIRRVLVDTVELGVYLA